jgi:hypothetical protein
LVCLIFIILKHLKTNKMIEKIGNGFVLILIGLLLVWAIIIIFEQLKDK